MIVLRSTLRAERKVHEAETDRLAGLHRSALEQAAGWRQRAEESGTKAGELAGRLAVAERERDEWKASASSVREAAAAPWRDWRDSLAAAIQAELDTALQCMHKPWPCGRENCSRGRYAAGLARALELAGTGGQDGSEDEGPEAGGES